MNPQKENTEIIIELSTKQLALIIIAAIIIGSILYLYINNSYKTPTPHINVTVSEAKPLQTQPEKNQETQPITQTNSTTPPPQPNTQKTQETENNNTSQNNNMAPQANQTNNTIRNKTDTSNIIKVREVKVTICFSNGKPIKESFAIEVRSPSNKVVWIDQKTITLQGCTTLTFGIPENSEKGMYTIYLSSKHIKAKKKFRLP